MTMYSISSSAGQFQNSKGCFLGVNSTLPFGSRWWGRSILWVFPEVPKWLNVFGLIGWFETFSEVLHFTFEIYSSSASSSQLQVVCQYLIFFLTGSVIVIDVSHVDIHCFLQRTQGVIDTDRHIRFQVLITPFRFLFLASHFTCDHISAFYEQDCQRSSLHCTFSSQINDVCNIHHHGKGLNTLQVYYSDSILSVLPCMNLCSTCFQISHCGQPLRRECSSVN